MYALFSCKPINPTTPFIRLSHSRPLSSCPDHPRATYQTARKSPSAPEPTKAVNTWPVLSLIPLPYLFLPQEPQERLSRSAPSLCLLTDPGASACGPAGQAVPPLSVDLSTVNVFLFCCIYLIKINPSLPAVKSLHFPWVDTPVTAPSDSLVPLCVWTTCHFASQRHPVMSEVPGSQCRHGAWYPRALGCC